MLHSFSMQAGTLKLLSQFDVGHTDLVTGTHRSQGSLYTCSSDCTVKVSSVRLLFALSTKLNLLLNSLVFKFLVCIPGAYPVCTSKDFMYSASSNWSQWGKCFVTNSSNQIADLL